MTPRAVDASTFRLMPPASWAGVIFQGQLLRTAGHLHTEVSVFRNILVDVCNALCVRPANHKRALLRYAGIFCTLYFTRYSVESVHRLLRFQCGICRWNTRHSGLEWNARSAQGTQNSVFRSMQITLLYFIPFHRFNLPSKIGAVWSDSRTLFSFSSWDLECHDFSSPSTSCLFCSAVMTIVLNTKGRANLQNLPNSNPFSGSLLLTDISAHRTFLRNKLSL